MLVLGVEMGSDTLVPVAFAHIITVQIDANALVVTVCADTQRFWANNTRLKPDGRAIGIWKVTQYLTQVALQFNTGRTACVQIQALIEFAQSGQIQGVLLHALMVRIDAVKIGIEGVGNLTLSQLGHGVLGKAQVQTGHQPHAEDEQQYQQAQYQHHRALDGHALGCRQSKSLHP